MIFADHFETAPIKIMYSVAFKGPILLAFPVLFSEINQTFIPVICSVLDWIEILSQHNDLISPVFFFKPIV